MLNVFKDDEIKKVVLADKAAQDKGGAQLDDKTSCNALILPREYQQIQDRRLLSAYLTESLLEEIERVKTRVARKDLISEIGTLNQSLKENLSEAVGICDAMIACSKKLEGQ